MSGGGEKASLRSQLSRREDRETGHILVQSLEGDEKFCVGGGHRGKRLVWHVCMM